jgi:hypothetical protein
VREAATAPAPLPQRFYRDADRFVLTPLGEAMVAGLADEEPTPAA